MKPRLVEHKMKTMLVWKHWRMLLKTKTPSCSSVDRTDISNEDIQYTIAKHVQVGGTKMPPGSAPTPEKGTVLASVLSWDASHNPALGFELMDTFPVDSKSRRSWCTAQNPSDNEHGSLRCCFYRDSLSSRKRCGRSYISAAIEMSGTWADGNQVSNYLILNMQFLERSNFPSQTVHTKK